MDAPEVAMDRFAGVQEMAPRAGRSERGGDLLADQPCLADPRHDHATGAMIQLFDRPTEFRVQPIGEPLEGLRLHRNDLPGVTKLLKRAQRPRGRRCGHAHRVGRP
jgi:hypothetical protein